MSAIEFLAQVHTIWLLKTHKLFWRFLSAFSVQNLDVLRSNKPFEGVRNLPIFWYMAVIMLGAYFKVDQRARKAQVSPEPCAACLRATLNARGIALEGTELGGSIPRVPISSAKAGCVDAKYIGEVSQRLTRT